ncbi:hypothetical protein B0T24DRAFT_593587 [Lasiosphaeria ovina]|uniref:Uncharacterized protein n=1 Tax=Lasiosphaeria ovina TaxID=92902 RepID=A0AAE0N8I3_9PEZI|nr:hypothetical protein B0T24DRAFT_593587 [Lasiosphaeria ovina]
MGLRLYEPPVESDTQSRPAADKSPAQARSTIRRARLVRLNPDQIRDRRRRALAATAAYTSYDPPPRRISSSPDSTSAASATGDNNDTGPDSEAGRRALRDVASRMGILDDRVVALFGERWAHLHAGAQNLDYETSRFLPSTIGPGLDSDYLPQRRLGRPPPAEQYTMVSNIRSTQAPDHPSRAGTRSPAALHRIRMANSMRQMRESRFATETRPALGPSRRRTARAPPYTIGPAPRPAPAPAPEPAPGAGPASATVDGLGDRNRSLSPEENAWDTLLSTLTPDPQPPSVGSSFASASALASATASQSAAAASSRTSFTNPDTAEESAFEPPCESGCENSETEGDEDDEMEHNHLTRFHRTVRDGGGDRSYADIVRDTGLVVPSDGDGLLELLGGIEDMQHIVRNLARREDIPDEWWAEAGLSRTLSREASSN